LDKTRDLAKTASPISHIDVGDPPLLILHGDQDPQIPVEQSYELQRAYEAAGLPVKLDVLRGAGHSGPAFFDKPHVAEAVDFLRDNLIKTVTR
jgi:dipeptidyl aminopeptidase/acylaminoacyl peptidase